MLDPGNSSASIVENTACSSVSSTGYEDSQMSSSVSYCNYENVNLEVSTGDSNIADYESASDSEEDEMAAEEEDESMDDLTEQFVGTRCRVPYMHAWGQRQMYNAVIMGIELPSDDGSETKVCAIHDKLLLLLALDVTAHTSRLMRVCE